MRFLCKIPEEGCFPRSCLSCQENVAVCVIYKPGRCSYEISDFDGMKVVSVKVVFCESSEQSSTIHQQSLDLTKVIPPISMLSITFAKTQLKWPNEKNY